MKLGEANATVVALTPETAGGAPTVSIAVRYEDGRVEQADMRADLIPEGLAIGDVVTVTKAALYRRWTITKSD